MKLLYCLAVLLLLLPGPLRADTPEAESVRACIGQLDSPDSARRRAALRELDTWAERAPLLTLQTAAEQYLRSGSVEARAVLEERMRPLALQHVLSRPQGFIGMTMSWDAGPHGPDGGPGIRIDTLLEGFPGVDAGLRADDVLLALDGRSVAELQSLNTFIAHISALPPGTPIELLLARDGRVLSLRVVLTERPRTMLRAVPVDEEKAYLDWLDRLQDQVPGDPEFPVGHFE